ncbi:ATP-dependent RNA helicase HrpA [Nigerium massiliense]|uniref:ATP-dependent RNA helicase HrpA n=1 Tax=Nigerium massiliense TaxID=1522317 RepID=UPI00058CBDFE|nr:ATP-dependent RNA helicase HrpA [Nigerium massiliense]
MTSTPELTFDPALPISAAVDDIRDAIEQHQVIVVAGETGSGKTTQLPKIALLAGRRSIGHTQPRRIAARTVAERIASEMGVEIGDTVGYQVRFTRKATSQTAVKLMTDGILLAEIAHDRDLRRYDTIIIDEAHERSLNIDFLLGYLKQLLPRRPDLRVIVTSATIDTARFSAHFDDAPIIEVSGRTYPVEVRYEPLVDPENERERDMIDGIRDAVQQCYRMAGGDILVFLSGEREIRDAADAIEALKLRGTEVVPLYARLSAAEQHRVFTPHAGTRIVLATNVAETSLTVPGIRYVVDPGFARISRYSARTKVQRLPIEPVSQASANQRAGRCGRVAPGVCIRLYSREDYESRPEFTEPEILRTNLASVILQMAQARLGPIQSFPFVEPPDSSQVRDGLRLLDELGALKAGHADDVRLTRTGRLLAQLPVDPRLGRMLVEAGRRGCLKQVTAIVAGLTVPDVRERPLEHQQEADTLHRRFWTPADAEDGTPRDPSDVAALLRLWQYLRRQRRELSGNAFRRLCRDEYLNFLRIREWQDLTNQLREITRELHVADQRSAQERDADPGAQPGGRTPARGQAADGVRGRESRGRDHGRDRAGDVLDAIHISVLAGLLSHVGLIDLRSVSRTGPQARKGRRPLAEYLGARGARFAIQPGSAAAKAEPPLVMAVELVETSRLWARMVAPVKAEWIEDVGAHLVKRSYSEPRWSASGGQCVATEKVLLLGVPIVSDRTVSYGRIDPAVARQMFIRHALVQGEWRTRHHFFARNERVRQQAEELEERTRRRDLVVDDQAIYDFYDAKVPESITTVAHFDRWWRDKRREEDGYLDLTLDDVMDDDAADVHADDFPEVWTVGGNDLPVSYSFDPGASADGVTVDLDVSVLNQVDVTPFTWNVPGLRGELATEMIRHLPKAQRRNFVPAPDWGGRALARLDADGAARRRPFPEALAGALTALSGQPVAASDFDLASLPEHLRVRYVVTDDTLPRGRQELGSGKDFDQLRKEFAPALNKRLNTAAPGITHPGATSWEFGTLPTTVELGGDGSLLGYPALVDQVATVGVRVANTAAKARRWQAAGLRRLVVLDSPDPTRSVFAHMANATKLALAASPYPSLADLMADARLKATGDLISSKGIDPDAVRDAAAFRAVVDAVRPDAADTMQRVVSLTGRILARYQEAERALAQRPDDDATRDIRAQLDNLVFPGFVSATPEPHLAGVERYVHAVEIRLAGLAANPARDRQNLDIIADLEDAYADAIERYDVGELPPEAQEVGWQLEELRVSLFAQSLGTARPVSAKRVRAAIAKLSG